MSNLNIAVIGSNRGIGLELTKQLSESNNNVFAFCRTSSPELKSLSKVTVVEDFDVIDKKGMTSHLKKLDALKANNDSDQNLNTPYFDLIIHVSGILHSDSIDEIQESNLVEQFTVNAMAPLLSVNAFLPYMKEHSKIGLITSRMGSVEDNTSGGMYGYRMSKAALNMAGKSLSFDLKEDDIAVFLLHPGYVKTDMTGHRGQITAKESAAGLIKILTDKTIEDTGTFWHVNGEKLPW